jgi:hypothetical protein
MHLAGLVIGTWVLFQTTPRTDLRIRVFWMPLALSALMGLFLLFVSDPRSPLEDFRTAYYAAGVSVQEGPLGLAPMIEKGVEGFVNLPIVAYLFWPLGLLPVVWASILFSLIGVACVLAAWWLLARLAALDTKQAAVLLFLFSANGPQLYSFKEGNLSHILLLLLVIALTGLRDKREFASGVLLGIVAVLKPPLVLIGIYFLFRRRWHVVAGGALSCAAIGLLSLMLFGWEMHERWYELCIRPYSEQPLAAFNVQSIQAFVLRYQVGPAGWFDWRPIAFDKTFGAWSKALVAATTLAVVLVMAKPVARHASAERHQELIEIEFMMIVALACIISPISWSHYHTWFLLPFAFFVGGRGSFCSTPLNGWLGWFGLVLLSGPVIGIHWPGIWASSLVAQLCVSLLLIGSLLWLGLLCLLRLRMAADRIGPLRVYHGSPGP